MELSIFTVVTSVTYTSLSTSPITRHFTSLFAFFPQYFVTTLLPMLPSTKKIPFPSLVPRFSLHSLWPLSLGMWYACGPATGHLDTGFLGFPVSLKQMLGWFPCLQVVTTCFSCNPPEVHSSIWTTTRLLYTCYKPLPPGSNPIAVE